jgi:excisionase family DNA binding protein
VVLIEHVLQAIADGATVTIEALPDEVTTTQAAQQLGISRPTVMKLIQSGELPSHMVGTHHRVNTSDVTAFRRTRLDKQRAAFEELRALEEQLEEF